MIPISYLFPLTFFLLPNPMNKEEAGGCAGCGCAVLVGFVLFGMVGDCINHANRVPPQHTVYPAIDYPSSTESNGYRSIRGQGGGGGRTNVPTPEELYGQLCRNRLILQEDIQTEIREFDKVSREVLNLREKIKRELINKNIDVRRLPEIIQMFQKNEVPSNLQLVHSYWNGLINEEAMQSIIKNLLDTYQREQTLEKMDNEIAFLDRERKLEKYGSIDENRIAAIKNMIGLQLDTSKRFTKGLSEQEIITRQIRTSRNW